MAQSNGIRITTWNVNGIRNPFAYQPWIELKTYGAMFDTLEADILILQELKIQKRDLTDDMVLVPGWDCYFTFPKHKRGYSGVAIYTRQSKVNPIKAEEGITGIHKPPQHPTAASYLALPPEEQIGGYPHLCREDALLLDSEGRALVLDFGAFVLIGTYSPANRDSSRDEFRHEFVRALLERCRNLIQMGRRVILTGDLNISRGEIDCAAAKDIMKKQGLNDYKDNPVRKMFDEFLEPHEKGIMVDLCREYWPDRKGMYTCWEQRIQARPGNYGSRIDYVLCSSDMRSWFSEANIQEGLMGSDHCPVYANMKSEVTTEEGRQRHLLDVINPPGFYVCGVAQSDSVVMKTYQQPRLSGRLLPEFATRRSIKDMFSKKSNAIANKWPDDNCQSQTGHSGSGQSSGGPTEAVLLRESNNTRVHSTLRPTGTQLLQKGKRGPPDKSPEKNTVSGKRGAGQSCDSGYKRVKSSPGLGGKAGNQANEGSKQTILAGFLFKSRSEAKASDRPICSGIISGAGACRPGQDSKSLEPSPTTNVSQQGNAQVPNASDYPIFMGSAVSAQNMANKVDTGDPLVTSDGATDEQVIDPVMAKEGWGKLFARRTPPRCEGHGEPCKLLTTKKAGQNCGRAFWTCARPVGPDGEEDRHSEWRCNFFMWSSDWGKAGGNEKA